MVRVSWEQSTGELISVRSSDGPGQSTETVNPSMIADRLGTMDNVSELSIAAAVMDVYDGSLDIEDSIVTTESYSETESPDVTTTIAFIEPSGLDSKLEGITCEKCGFSPNTWNDWNSLEREGSELRYTDWICPECESIVHIQAV